MTPQEAAKKNPRERTEEEATLALEDTPGDRIFPFVRRIDYGTNGNSMEVQTYGLSKRGLFAAMAMQGFISHFGTCDLPSHQWPMDLAKRAISAADALIEELKTNK